MDSLKQELGRAEVHFKNALDAYYEAEAALQKARDNAKRSEGLYLNAARAVREIKSLIAFREKL